MRPSLGVSSPTIRRAMVDLPQPDSPTSARVSPRRTSSVTPSTARSSLLPSPSSTRSSQGRETSKSRETASALSNGARMQPAGGLARSGRHQLGTRAQAALEALRAARVKRAAARDRVEARHCAFDLREARARSEEHTSELQSLAYLVCRLLLEKKKQWHFTTPRRQRLRSWVI